MNHSECVRELIAIGNRLGFHATGRSYSKMYHMGNPDCVWYYKGPAESALRKIAKGDRYGLLQSAEEERDEDRRELDEEEREREGPRKRKQPVDAKKSKKS